MLPDVLRAPLLSFFTPRILLSCSSEREFHAREPKLSDLKLRHRDAWARAKLKLRCIQRLFPCLQNEEAVADVPGCAHYAPRAHAHCNAVPSCSSDTIAESVRSGTETLDFFEMGVLRRPTIGDLSCHHVPAISTSTFNELLRSSLLQVGCCQLIRETCVTAFAQRPFPKSP